MNKYKDAIIRLFPPGLAWNNNPILFLVAQAFATTLKALDYTSRALIMERYTQHQNHSLEEWEQTFGLPGDCAELEQNRVNRGLAVIARRIAQGGQHEDSYHALAKTFGYEIEIIKYPAMIADYARVGQPIGAAPLETTIKITNVQTARMRSGEFEVGTQLTINERLNRFVCVCKNKAAAYGKIHFVTEN